jgi:hypothetical protein
MDASFRISLIIEKFQFVTLAAKLEYGPSDIEILRIGTGESAEQDSCVDERRHQS